MPVAVVTDSTAYLPPEPVAKYAISVLPLPVTLSGSEGREGVDVTPADVTVAMAQRRVRVTTSRLAPAELVECYRRLFDEGATGVVSVHISSKLSGTYDAAVSAAAEFDGKVRVVDSLSTAMGLGFPVLAAARTAGRGRGIDIVERDAVAAVKRTTTMFYVDTLEFLRRGGRIGAASALVGTALAVKPILHVDEGTLVVREKLRTASRALARLADLLEAAGHEGAVDVAVHHLAAPGPAEELAARLKERFGRRLRILYTSEVGAAVGAHVGPGLVGAVVHRRVD
ncbi:DegV family protein [Phytomonospora sp. NPDC050363]|uniref:DegV family protein n=1 Tax=Phytomonospora sp. NPDC050363 TaxID=3155642 RepID=UPI0033EE62D0